MFCDPTTGSYLKRGYGVIIHSDFMYPRNSVFAWFTETNEHLFFNHINFIKYQSSDGNISLDEVKEESQVGDTKNENDNL